MSTSKSDIAHGVMEHAPQVVFGWDPMIVSTVVLCVAYFFIISEKINRAVIALLGSGAMIIFGVLNQELAVQGIDFNTIFLLIGMMAIVGIMKDSGVFQYVCYLGCKISTGRSTRLISCFIGYYSGFLSSS